MTYFYILIQYRLQFVIKGYIRMDQLVMKSRGVFSFILRPYTETSCGVIGFTPTCNTIGECDIWCYCPMFTKFPVSRQCLQAATVCVVCHNCQLITSCLTLANGNLYLLLLFVQRRKFLDCFVLLNTTILSLNTQRSDRLVGQIWPGANKQLRRFILICYIDSVKC